MNFEQKIVLVTGAGRGLGRAMAEAFAAFGALVAANDITPINLDQTIEHITQAGGIARDYVEDVAKKMSVQAMVNQVLDEWERIDILINSANVEPHASLLDMDAWDWQRTLDVNLSGSFFTTQILGRVMREQGGGVILNMALTEGIAHGSTERAAFIASKVGLIGMTREAARELAAYNIRVNALCPGVVNTIRTSHWSQYQKRAAKWLATLPQNRLAGLQEVVALALFLCSDAAKDITGQVINVEAGT